MADPRAAALEDVESTAILMAQELQEFCDEAEECGNPLTAVQALVDDWERVYSNWETVMRQVMPL